jgi:hypothetical protein
MYKTKKITGTHGLKTFTAKKTAIGIMALS